MTAAKNVLGMETATFPYRVPSHPLALDADMSIQYSSGGSKKPKMDLSYRIMCPDCQNPQPSNMVEDFASGDIICRDCGVVIMDRLIDTRSEWRTFSSDTGGEDPSRVGGPTDPLFLEFEGEMNIDSTLISKVDGAYDLSRAHNRASGKAYEKHLLSAFRSIGEKADRIGLPKMISDRARLLFKKVDEQKLLKGKNVDGIVAACIYIACRLENVPRTFKEISALMHVPKRDLGRCFKILQPILMPKMPPLSQAISFAATNSSNSHQRSPEQSSYGSATVSTQDFLARFCSYLNLNMDVQKAALVICQRAMLLESIAGKSPISVAAAGIFMVTQLFPQYKKAQKDIAYVAGVSEVTIRNTYKDMYASRYMLVTSDVAPKSLIDAMLPV